MGLRVGNEKSYTEVKPSNNRVVGENLDASPLRRGSVTLESPTLGSDRNDTRAVRVLTLLKQDINTAKDKYLGVLVVAAGVAVVAALILTIAYGTHPQSFDMAKCKLGCGIGGGIAGLGLGGWVGHRIRETYKEDERNNAQIDSDMVDIDEDRESRKHSE